MNIVRKYKLSLLKYHSLTEKELEDLNIIFKFVNSSYENFELIEFIYNNLFNLKQVKLKKYPKFLFYFKHDKCIFYHGLTNYNFYVNYNLIWLVIYNKFNYNDQQIRSLIKNIVEQNCKLNGVRPLPDTMSFSTLEKVYKNQLNEYSKTI